MVMTTKAMEEKIKVLKTEKDHADALKMIEALMSLDPDPESEAGERLSILSTLIQDYESRAFPESLPDPVDAILFRMEQQDLKPRDLIPYIGSRSKVSEILSRKRPLTISMIRSLEAGLGIPAKVLVKEVDEFRNPEQIVWSHFPIKEMGERGYFGNAWLKPTAKIDELTEDFFRPLGSPAMLFGHLRKSTYRSSRPMDKHALAAWSAYVVKKAGTIKNLPSFKQGTVNLELMQTLAHLSVENRGPLLAVDFLRKNGIALVIEPPFPKTYLDGATIIFDKKSPVIGLTIRHDRLDNFWFTLMHELAHIALHYGQNTSLFYDDLDNPDPNDARESEADRLAGEALVPADKWENSPARLIPSPIAAQSLAKELRVNVAIVAGKMRHEDNRYVYLNSIISGAKVRALFREEKWK
jgi:HTH-type transcriptional regulator/antitoxin HigA